MRDDCQDSPVPAFVPAPSYFSLDTVLLSLSSVSHALPVFIYSFACLSAPLASVPVALCFCLCSAVNSLPLLLELLCVTQASDPPSSPSHSKMDGVHFKLLYHGKVQRCCRQATHTFTSLLCLVYIAVHSQSHTLSNTDTQKC